MWSSVISTASPDLVHVSHVFEGFGDRVGIPSVLDRAPGQVMSATLYDLIPMRFPEHYFNNLEFKRWYYHRLSFYHQADLLLAISEASRQDAIELLGIAPDKIVTILGGVGEQFQPATDRSAAKLDLRQRYDLKRPGIVLYTGGDDYRKNLVGAIEAFAALPDFLRTANHLVIICAMEGHRRDFFRALALKSGLTIDDVVFLGFVPEPDLALFYSVCDAFFFPSLYEGLGFPVIEAMACGAPVLCGNNSSLPELVDRADATFDSASTPSIAERLSAVLTDKGFAENLRLYGVERAKRFTWRNVAGRALEAFDEALARKRVSATSAALAGHLAKPRMAMLTPLPPCRSGIADYNAQFLPYLASHFEIDLFVDGYECTDMALNSAFRIFDASDFRKSASSYDVILYELGNSEFHSYMLPLLEEYPGVVGLHDAYLSGLVGYLEFNLGEADRFSREMLLAHGTVARRLFAPLRGNTSANSTAMVTLPCTKRVLDRAIGIISHSNYNLQVAQACYPQGWLAPYRIIPQMIKVASPKSEAEIAFLRAELGFQKSDFIVTTFGHVGWTKWGDRLLEAFLQSDLAQDERCHLIFAGELAKDDFGPKLESSIHKSGLRDRIKITGFLSEEDYGRYQRITDLAVQLRTNSRGGTPRSVLDCLASGVPVIVNNEASFLDYPDDVVVKLSAAPSPSEIASALSNLHGDEGRRKEFGSRGLQYVRVHHDPEILAAQYAGAIHEFTARHKTRSANHFNRGVAPHLAALPDPISAAKLTSAYLAARPSPRFRRPRLIIDCSHIVQNDHGTGIQRVVRETVRAAYCSARPGFEALAVERVGDQVVPAVRWLNQQRVLLPHEAVANNSTPVQFEAGDQLLMLDSSWAAYDEFAPIFAAARKARVPIITAVYDLLPITLPAGNFVPGGKEWFEEWLRKAVAASDGLACISKAVADDLIQFINENKLVRPGLSVGWWHLGSTLPTSAELGDANRVRSASCAPYCLMVGTIEPRKNHALALDAFELLWASGSDLKLVIAGNAGWLVDGLMERMLSHAELNRRLFVFGAATDAEIDYLYRNSSMLLFISKGEGFGLPLVEAAHYGRPIVCSRIRSFVEIAQDNAIYVGVDDAGKLASELLAAWELIRSGAAPDSGAMNRLTWEESTDRLLDIIIDQNWYWSA